MTMCDDVTVAMELPLAMRPAAAAAAAGEEEEVVGGERGSDPESGGLSGYLLDVA